MPHLPRLRPAAIVALLLLAFPSIPTFAQQLEVHPVRTGASAQSLNGTWEFAYHAGLDGDIPFGELKPITVPGHWELQGFAEPKYGRELAAGWGLYVRGFRVPEKWRGQRIMLRFDGVLSGFDVRVNGRMNGGPKIGSWASGYNPVTFDITDAVRFGGQNELLVHVTTRSHGWEFDTNDCWSLSGIYRDVTLFAVPAAHLQHFTARTKLAADGSATVSVSTLTSAPASVKGRLLDPDGRKISELEFESDKPTVAEARVTVAKPALWTAETPALYTLELELSSGQKITERIGLREVTIVDGVLQLNGRPIKLRGVDHHDIWPEQGRVATEALMRRDLELMRAANINFIRTSHYPPHPRLLELCDEMGFYVMDEVPFGFGEEHLADENYRDALLTRARATVLRDENRPSVIIWSVGNENQNTPLTLATARRAKELDPTRPVCFPQIGSYFAKSYEELPGDIDLYAPHYPSTLTVQDYARKLTRPVIFTEYAHALGLASDQIQEQWAIMQANPRLAGGAIWMFQDQGILVAAKPGETPASTHELGLNVWPDAQHYHDSHGNQGMDGIVYSDRTPQTDYWQVRKVYSPVQIATRELKLPAGKGELTIPVENRFDFRSLAGCKLEWSLIADNRTVQSGALPLQAAARTMETVAIPVDAALTQAALSTWLTLRCRDEKGASFYERSIVLQPAKDPAPKTEQDWGFATAALTLEETPEAVVVGHPSFRLTVTRATGETALHDTQGTLLASGFLPHAGRRLTEGEFVRAKKENPWRGALLAPAAPPEITVKRREQGAIELEIRGRYPRPGVPDESLEGSTYFLIEPSGLIETGGRYKLVNGHGLLLEAGLALRGAANASEFHWMGDGPYPGYPGKDALNEFGRYHLNRADLNFSGNRRNVSFAALVSPTGTGVAIFAKQATDVAVEDDPAGVILSQNAVLAGRGTKFVGPDVFPKAESTPYIQSGFYLLPLSNQWPVVVRNFLGAPDAAQPFRPYFHSYDQ